MNCLPVTATPGVLPCIPILHRLWLLHISHCVLWPSREAISYFTYIGIIAGMSNIPQPLSGCEVAPAGHSPRIMWGEQMAPA